MSQTVAVFGAIGAQGGSVVRALLCEPKQYHVVVIISEVNCDKAKALKLSGAEIRICDLSSLCSVEAALKGVQIVFGVTDYCCADSADEIENGQTIIDASKKTGIRHFVFSSLENTRSITCGKRLVRHFDSKATVEDYLAKSGIPFTVIEAACYYETIKTLLIQNGEHLEFALPVTNDNKIALFSVEDTGIVVGEIIKYKERYLNKKIAITGDYISPNDIAFILSTRLGKPVKYNYVAEEVFASSGIPGAKEIANMFAYFNDYGCFGEKVNGRDIWEGKTVMPDLLTFVSWTRKWKL